MNGLRFSQFNARALVAPAASRLSESVSTNKHISLKNDHLTCMSVGLNKHKMQFYKYSYFELPEIKHIM